MSLNGDFLCRISLVLNVIKWRFPVSNFTQIGQEMWKVRLDIYWSL